MVRINGITGDLCALSAKSLEELVRQGLSMPTVHRYLHLFPMICFMGIVLFPGSGPSVEIHRKARYRPVCAVFCLSGTAKLSFLILIHVFYFSNTIHQRLYLSLQILTLGVDASLRDS